MRNAVVCLLLLSACHHPASQNAVDDLESSSDLTQSDLAPPDLTSTADAAASDLLLVPATVNGVVWTGPCQPAAGVTVSVLGASTPSAMTSTDGAFSLANVAPGAVLELTATGYAPTLSLARQAPASWLLPLVTEDTVLAAYLFAGVTMDDGTGTVAIGLGDAQRLPIGGATAVLVPVGGGAEIFGRYVAQVGSNIALNGASTDEKFGGVVFLAVPEGNYTLLIAGTSATFPDAAVTVKAGYVTADVLLATSGVGTPLVFSGKVLTNPNAPYSGSPTQGIPGSIVTLTSASHNVSVTTANDGSYALAVPFAYEYFDFTASAATWTTARSPRECLTPYSNGGSPFARSLTVEQPRFAYSEMMTAYSGKAPIAGTAAINVLIPIADDGSFPPNMTVTLDPPVAGVVADYGTSNLSFPDDCFVRAGCGDDNPCPDGSRCDTANNECLQGAAPYCSHCTADYKCSAGYVEEFDADSRCFCVQQVPSCLTSACDDSDGGSVCWTRPHYSNESDFKDVCLPWHHTIANARSRAAFANVPPGIYTVSASTPTPGFFFVPTTVRIDADSANAGYMHATVAVLWGTN